LRAARSERGAGGFDGIDPERHVPPAGERVDGCLLQGQLGLVDFEHDPAGETEKEGGRRLAVVEDQFGAENAEVPVLQRQGIAGGQAEVFDGELHARILGRTRPEGTENAGKSAMGFKGQSEKRQRSKVRWNDLPHPYPLPIPGEGRAYGRCNDFGRAESVRPRRGFERPINWKNTESTRGKAGRADARLTPGCTSVRLRH